MTKKRQNRENATIVRNCATGTVQPEMPVHSQPQHSPTQYPRMSNGFIHIGMSCGLQRNKFRELGYAPTKEVLIALKKRLQIIDTILKANNVDWSTNPHALYKEPFMSGRISWFYLMEDNEPSEDCRSVINHAGIIEWMLATLAGLCKYTKTELPSFRLLPSTIAGNPLSTDYWNLFVNPPIELELFQFTEEACKLFGVQQAIQKRTSSQMETTIDYDSPTANALQSPQTLQPLHVIPKRPRREAAPQNLEEETQSI